jgi:hypothetical protein
MTGRTCAYIWCSRHPGSRKSTYANLTGYSWRTGFGVFGPHAPLFFSKDRHSIESSVTAIYRYSRSMYLGFISIIIEITDLGHGVVIAQYLQRGRLLVKVVPIITGKSIHRGSRAASHRSISPNKFREVSAIHLSHGRLAILSNLSPAVIMLQTDNPSFVG